MTFLYDPDILRAAIVFGALWPVVEMQYYRMNHPKPKDKHLLPLRNFVIQINYDCYDIGLVYVQ